MLRRSIVTAKEIEAELTAWQERVDIIRHKLKFIRTLPGVACIEEINPLQTAGGRIPGMVEIAGGNALTTENGVLPVPPDIAILMLPGLDIPQSLGKMDALLQENWFMESPALKNNQVFIVDCQKYFQPGPGLIDSVELLAEVIGAADFYFGFEGDGWVRFEA